MILKLAGHYGSFSSRCSVKKSRIRSSKRLLKRILSSGVDLLSKVDTSAPVEDLSSNFDGVRASSDGLPLGVTHESSDY